MKTTKNFLSAVGLSILCAAPMLNVLNVSAANSYVDYTKKFETYSIYCDVPANSGVMWANLVLDCKNMELESYIGDFGGDVTDASAPERPAGDYSFAACYRAPNVITSSGNMFYTLAYTQNGFTAENISITSFDGNRVVMKNNPATYHVVLVGDVNGDETVDLADVAAFNQYLGNPLKYSLNNYRAGDTNFDGNVDEADVELIQKYVAGVIKGF